MNKSRLIFGVGINDAEYTIRKAKTKNGTYRQTWCCPYYDHWRHMLARCYSKKASTNNSSYSDCYVCDEWLLFSSFRSWMEKQDWEGKQLDKDIINGIARIYSPETCAFVTKKTNTFINNSVRRNTERLAGFTVRGSVVKAQCRNPFTGKNESLGSFLSKEEAHRAWKARKNEIAIELADIESDYRVKAALRSLFT